MKREREKERKRERERKIHRFWRQRGSTSDWSVGTTNNLQVGIEKLKNTFAFNRIVFNNVLWSPPRLVAAAGSDDWGLLYRQGDGTAAGPTGRRRAELLAGHRHPL